MGKLNFPFASRFRKSDSRHLDAGETTLPSAHSAHGYGSSQYRTTHNYKDRTPLHLPAGRLEDSRYPDHSIYDTSIGNRLVRPRHNSWFSPSKQNQVPQFSERRHSSGLAIVSGHTDKQNYNDLYRRDRRVSEGMYSSSTSPSVQKPGKGRVMMKVETVSLYWPLIDPTQGKRSRKPPVYFDVAFDPRKFENLRVRNSIGMEPLPEEARQLPACSHETLTRMTIQCPAAYAIGVNPWYITVERPAWEGGIRCIDVFTAIYETYRRKFPSSDYQNLDLQTRGRLDRHFRARCSDTKHFVGWEQMEGYRYVDLLLGSQRRLFKGLKQRRVSPAVIWELELYDLSSPHS